MWNTVSLSIGSRRTKCQNNNVPIFTMRKETVTPDRKQSLLFFAILIACLSCSFAWVGCGAETTVHAQQTITPAILSGYCDAGGPPTSPDTFLVGLGGGAGCQSLIGTNNTGVPMPSAGTLQNLHLSSLRGVTVTVMVNGNSTAMTCTVSSTGSLPGTCSDSTHTIQVAAGDLVAVQASSASSTQIQGVQVSLEKQ